MSDLKGVRAGVAQLVEHVIRNDGVVGSSPITGTVFFRQLIEIPSILTIEGDRRVTHSVHNMPFRYLLL